MRRSNHAVSPDAVRVLTGDEIARLWEAIDTAVMTPAIRLGLKLLLITGQRARALLHACWRQFDSDGHWLIPSQGRAGDHIVPLPAFAVELLREMNDLTGTCRYVLGAPKGTSRETPPCEWALQVAVRRNRGHFGIAPFTVQDLRRTVAHGMFSLGIPIGIVAETLDMPVGELDTLMFVRADFYDERAAALEKWANCLQRDLLGLEIEETMHPPAKGRSVDDDE